MTRIDALTPDQIVTTLAARGIPCEVLGQSGGEVIRGVLDGIVYYVRFYKPVDEARTAFSSISIQAGKNIGLSVLPNSLLNVCNDLNQQYRFCKFSMGGDEEKYVTVAMDFDVFSEPVEGFIEKWEWFENLLPLFSSRVVESRALVLGEVAELHDRAIEAQWGEVRDYPLAAKLYRQAAELGFGGSQNNLGDLYEDGCGVPKSDVVAAYWYARAAERGEPTAYMSLATLLARTAEDEGMLSEAAMFALLALRHLSEGTNSSISAACYNDLKARIGSESLKAAIERASGWLPLFQEAAVMSDTPDPNDSYVGAADKKH
jgi:hypothetical protein